MASAITPHHPAGTTAPSRPPWSMLLPLAAAAAAAEAVLLRGATRTLIHIPGIDQLENPVRALAEVARFAYYLAVVLLIALLVTLLRRQHDSTRSAAVTTAVAAFLSVAGAVRLGLVGDLPMALAVLAAVAILIAPATRQASSWRRRLPIAAFSAAFIVAGLHSAIQLAAAHGWTVDTPATGLLLAAEVLAVGGALLSPTLVPRAGLLPAMAAILVGALIFAALIAGGETVRILMLWNLGLGGWLPDFAYVAAAALLTYTAIAAWRNGQPKLALVLVLLTCGGIGLHSTYQSGLVVGGLAVLAVRARADDIAHAETSVMSRRTSLDSPQVATT